MKHVDPQLTKTAIDSLIKLSDDLTSHKNNCDPLLNLVSEWDIFADNISKKIKKKTDQLFEYDNDCYFAIVSTRDGEVKMYKDGKE